MTTEVQIREHPNPPEEGGYSPSELRPDAEKVDDVIRCVSEAEGDLCIRIVGRIGAMPYFRPTPYRNHRGVLVRMWSCISQYPKAMPGRTMLFGRRTVIWPDESDEEYNVNMFTREWVWDQVWKSKRVEIVPAEESPFCTDWYNWHWEEREHPEVTES